MRAALRVVIEVAAVITLVLGVIFGVYVISVLAMQHGNGEWVAVGVVAAVIGAAILLRWDRQKRRGPRPRRRH